MKGIRARVKVRAKPNYPECPLCLERSLKYRCEYSFEDVGADGDGIVTCYDCASCGCTVEAWMAVREDDT